MARTAKPKRTKRPARELRVQSIVLVNADGVECGRIQAADRETFIRLGHAKSDFSMELAVRDDHARMDIENKKRDSDDRCCVSLGAYGKGPSGNWSKAGYGTLELHPDRPKGSEDERPICSIEHEQALTLRRFAEFVPTTSEAHGLNHAVRMLRKIHRESLDGWEYIQTAIHAVLQTMHGMRPTKGKAVTK